MAYLFVHFREMWTEKGEQVYFALSKNGYDWEIINDGNPVITAKKGDLGVRDIVIARTRDNRFVIMATDLALIKNIDTKYKGNIRNAFKDGSKAIAMWKSDDLVNWSDEILLQFDDDNLGCFWAPGIFFDDESGEYVVHWSSSNKNDDYSGLAIYYSVQRILKNFQNLNCFVKKQTANFWTRFYINQMAHIIFLLKVQTILKQLYMKPHNLYMDRMKEIFFLMNKWLLWKNVILTKHRWFIHYQIKKSA